VNLGLDIFRQLVHNDIHIHTEAYERYTGHNCRCDGRIEKEGRGEI